MQLLRHVGRTGARISAPVVALGTFEGVHIGHQRALQRARELLLDPKDTPAAILIHPRAVAEPAPRVDSWRQRLDRIARLGADPIVVNRTSSDTATTVETLLRRIDARTLVLAEPVGALATADLADIGRRCGFTVEALEPMTVDGIEVTTASLRQAILAGDLAGVRRMLGRDHEVSGRVRRGFQRGRTIGFPTANLRIHGIALPPNGVYAVRLKVGERLFGGVANLGVNPTFGGNQRTLEPHIFDLDEDLYGTRLCVEFVASLRAERKFAGIEALVQQIRRDAEAARAILERA